MRLGQWEDPVWEDPATEWPDPGPGPDPVEWWETPEPDATWDDVHEIVRPGVLEAPVAAYESYSQSALDRAAAELVGAPRAGANWLEQTATRAITGLSNAIPLLVRGLFPAGLPPVWTPCPSGTYWTGSGCALKPSRCPEGTYWTGAGCAKPSPVRYPWEGGIVPSGGEGGWGGELGAPLGALTLQPWFWPTLIVGGVVVTALLVRRR